MKRAQIMRVALVWAALSAAPAWAQVAQKSAGETDLQRQERDFQKRQAARDRAVDKELARKDRERARARNKKR